jgi:hypothetical protein
MCRAAPAALKKMMWRGVPAIAPGLKRRCDNQESVDLSVAITRASEGGGDKIPEKARADRDAGATKGDFPLGFDSSA